MGKDKKRGYDPDIHGNWQNEEKPCACPCSYLRAKNFYRIECDFMKCSAKRWANAGRVTLGLLSAPTLFIPGINNLVAEPQLQSVGQDITHNALEVHYECGICGQIAYRTYEIVCEDVTSDRWGRYMKTYGKESIGGIRTTEFDGIQRVFDGMWKDYDLINNNCKNWTSQMIRRLS
ncbi:hypothetical protein niasHS_015593 [Heterodera schachtii]|uniref:PPPDE domain-containing protein n=1 Tax=Heterodera schachtii TaxID=97005 RepID=A0ABD2HQU1_HETSC